MECCARNSRGHLPAASSCLRHRASPRRRHSPTSSIRLVVAFPPGGATDVIARVLAQGLTTELGQNVLVENKGGASGMIGSEMVAKSPPDGYTLLFAPSSHATLKELYPTLSFDPLRDFTPIATVARTPYILVVHPGLECEDRCRPAGHGAREAGLRRLCLDRHGHRAASRRRSAAPHVRHATSFMSPTRAAARCAPTCWPAASR